MSFKQFDRFSVRMESLAARDNKKRIENDHVSVDAPAPSLPDVSLKMIDELATRMRLARQQQRPRMITFGAHAIKNGLGPVFLRLIETGWVTHLATNGAGVIHDWEFAYQGKSCENVEQMVDEGRFGNWQDTGFWINLALNVGVFEARGYGESIGALIENEGLQIPTIEQLQSVAREQLEEDPRQAAAAADLMWVVKEFELNPGWLEVPHPWKQFSIQAGAFRQRIPFTGHPMFGHDIIYNHPMNVGACVGRAAERDFLIFAESVSQIDGGVYVSIGSSVMSPMIFEKSLSMAQNLAIQQNTHIDRHFVLVNDLAECHWDWSQGEPPEKNPAYYLRYNKTFSRMGGEMRYLQADNRDFLLNLLHALDTRLDSSPS